MRNEFYNELVEILKYNIESAKERTKRTPDIYIHIPNLYFQKKTLTSLFNKMDDEEVELLKLIIKTVKKRESVEKVMSELQTAFDFLAEQDTYERPDIEHMLEWGDFEEGEENNEED